MDVVLRRAAAKRALRRTMGSGADAIRAAHALDLVLGFPGAIEMQPVEQRRRIEIAGMMILALADERDPSAGREVFQRIFRRADHADVELLDPVSRRRRRRLVP